MAKKHFANAPGFGPCGRRPRLVYYFSQVTCKHCLKWAAGFSRTWGWKAGIQTIIPTRYQKRIAKQKLDILNHKGFFFLKDKVI